MFIRVFDVELGANTLLPIRDIKVARETMLDGNQIIGARSIIETKDDTYYVSETLSEVEALITTALDNSF